MDLKGVLLNKLQQSQNFTYFEISLTYLLRCVWEVFVNIFIMVCMGSVLPKAPCPKSLELPSW